MKNVQKTLLALGMVSGFGIAGQAIAQDCASPLPIRSMQQNVTGDTCTAANSLPTYGGTGSPQNEVIYSFTAQQANATITITGTGGYAGTTPAVFLLPACTAATDPIQFGAAGTPMTVNGLTDGQTYYVAVTADPGGPNGGCGQFDVDVDGTLPVSLKSFTIE